MRTLGPSAPYRLAAAAVALADVLPTAATVLPRWREATGGEAYWVAQSLLGGGGYSFPGGHRWLFDFVDNNQFLSVGDGPFQITAWTDPLYTFFLAGLIGLFGEYPTSSWPKWRISFSYCWSTGSPTVSASG